MNARTRTALIVSAVLVLLAAAASGWQSTRTASVQRAEAQPTSVVLAWGCNAHGELGVVPPNTHVPSVVAGLPTMVALAAGFGHSLAIDDKGNVWSWGDNDLGQLGTGSRNSSLLPVKIATLGHAKAVAAGAGHSLALLEDGTVWTWGDNRDGELGVEGVSDSDAPLQVKGLANVEAIAAGGRHTLALLHDGSVRVWGTNGYGQLCNGTTAESRTPISLEPPVGEQSPLHFTAIAAGQYHTLVLDQTGHAWSCGWNVFGQLGNDSFTPPKEGERRLGRVVGLDEVTALAAGHLHSVALRRDGTVWAWGYNTQGQVGNDEAESHRPQLVKGVSGAIAVTSGATTSLAILADRSVVAWGANVFGAIGNNSLHNWNGPTKVPSLHNVRLLVAGGNRGMAIAESPAVAELRSFGSNDHGQLGPFAKTDRGMGDAHLEHPRGIAAGFHHSLAISDDGHVWAWGQNDHGQLGNGNLAASKVPVQVQGLDHVAAVAAGEHHSVGLRADGTVWTWGSNAHGQLAQQPSTDSLAPVQVQGLDKVVAIAAGQAHTLALRFDRRVWAWGSDQFGQLGLMGGGETRVPSQIDGIYGICGIAAGARHSLAVRANGHVYAWGDNRRGQLGHPGITESHVPIEADRVDDATFVAAGHYQSFAVQSGGSLWGWGSDAAGELGVDRAAPIVTAPQWVTEIRDVASVASGDHLTVALQREGRAWSWGLFGQTSVSPRPMDDASPRSQVSAGQAHVLLR